MEGLARDVCTHVSCRCYACYAFNACSPCCVPVLPADPPLDDTTRKHHDALVQRLAVSDPLEKDQALLESGLLKDWRLRTILQFRVQRKQALRLNAAKLAAALNLGAGSSGSDGSSSSGSTAGQAAASEREEQQSLETGKDEGDARSNASGAQMGDGRG